MHSIDAFKLSGGSEPLFTQIKKDARARIQETAVTAEALLPEGPYNLWRAGEESRRVKDLVYAFDPAAEVQTMVQTEAEIRALQDHLQAKRMDE